MFQYPRGQNVSVPSYCILLPTLLLRDHHRAQEKKQHLNSILILGDCGERLTLVVAPGYHSCKKFK